MSNEFGALPLRVVSYDLLGSTQDEMRRRLSAGDDVHGLVVQAAVQSEARGQRARDWQAGRGGSYQTLAVRGAFPGHAALVLALGLAEVLPVYGVQVGLKWPNDLLYRGKKLAGVLAERALGHLLVGVGLNVNNPLPEGATGLRGWDVQGANMAVLQGLQRGLAHLADPAFDLPGAYRPFDLLYGEALELRSGDALHRGVGAGVDGSGRLLLRRVGELTAFSSGRLAHYGLRTLPRQPSAARSERNV